MRGGRGAVDVLRQVLQALPAVHGVPQRGEPRRAQGGQDWHPRLGGGVHADAIMDRIVHNAVWVDMGEANMRQRRG